jgi:hypothetical protein
MDRRCGGRARATGPIPEGDGDETRPKSCLVEESEPDDADGLAGRKFSVVDKPSYCVDPLSPPA